MAFVCLAVVGYGMYKGSRDAHIVGAGILALALVSFHDIATDQGWMVGPRFAMYGFVVLIIGIAVTLAVRFHYAVEELATLSRELEQRVKERTEELSEAYRRMEDLALRDSLTDLLNRRAIEQRAAAALSFAHRRGTSFSVALIDVDHFKAINDTHGHAVGDRVLVGIANALTSISRASDDIARWGGEEFLLLLHDADSLTSMKACERLRAAIEEVSVLDEHAVRISATVSIGLATADLSQGRMIDFEDLVRYADHALYRAKKTGRNRICLSGDPVRTGALKGVVQASSLARPVYLLTVIHHRFGSRALNFSIRERPTARRTQKWLPILVSSRS